MTKEQNQPSGPPFPPWVFKWIMNPGMTLLLRSPLHGLVSQRLLLLTFTGHKSGKQFTTPLGYEREEEKLIIMTRRPWWKNFRGGAPVRVRLQDKTQKAVATAITDPEQIAAYIGRSLLRNDAEFNVRRFGLRPERPEAAKSPDQVTLLAAARGQQMIQIELKG